MTMLKNGVQDRLDAVTPPAYVEPHGTAKPSALGDDVRCGETPPMGDLNELVDWWDM